MIALLPLQGKCYLLTRAPHQMAVLEQLLQSYGATTLAFPTLEIQPLGITPQIMRYLEQPVESFVGASERTLWWIFNSANGVASVLGSLDKAKRDQIIATVSVACVGPKTAQKLMSYGITPVIVPEVHRAEALGEALVSYFTDNDLLPATQTLVLWQAEQGLPTLQQVMTQAGYTLHTHPVYQTVKPLGCNAEALQDLLSEQMPQGVIFTSPSSVRHFQACLTPALQQLLNTVDYYSIGPVTSDAILAHLGPVALQAEPYTLEGLVTNLCAFVERHQV